MSAKGDYIMEYGRCQVCNNIILRGGCIDPDSGLRLCSQHWDTLDTKGMMDARFQLSRTRDKILVLDLQGTQVCAIEKSDIDTYFSVMTDMDLYEEIYGGYYDVLTDLGVIEEEY